MAVIAPAPMPAPVPSRVTPLPAFWLLLGAVLFFVGGTYAQIAAGFGLDKTLALIAFALVNVSGLILFATVFRLKMVVGAMFMLSMLFLGMAAAAHAWGA